MNTTKHIIAAMDEKHTKHICYALRVAFGSDGREFSLESFSHRKCQNMRYVILKSINRETPQQIKEIIDFCRGYQAAARLTTIAQEMEV